MPELPEVETARKYVHNLCAGSKIVRVVTREQGKGPRDGLFDDIIFEDNIDPSISQALQAFHNSSEKNKKKSSKKEHASNVVAMDREASFQTALLNRHLLAVRRKGKQMWFEFEDKDEPINNDLAVLFHFGMTGSFVIRDHAIPTYKSFKIVTREEWPPKFTKLELEFSNGIHIAFCDPRRIGRIKLRLNPMECPPLSDLGLDPSYEQLPSVTELRAKLQAYSTSIKALILDQEKLFCGIGNYLADEVLYQAGIHPETRACDINEAGCQKVLDKLRYILHTAIEADAKYEDFPRKWLFHYRWDKVKANSGEKIRMPDGNPIVFETCGGRTSAVVPAVQPKNGYYLAKVTAKSTISKTATKTVKSGSHKPAKESTSTTVKAESSIEVVAVKPKRASAKRSLKEEVVVTNVKEEAETQTRKKRKTETITAASQIVSVRKSARISKQ